jgi:hypothetical protein
MIVVKVETVKKVISVNQVSQAFTVVVKQGDDATANQAAARAAASAAAALAAEAVVLLAEQVTIDNAIQSVEAAAGSLASKIESESASATSTEQAILSASARNEAEAAKLAAQDSEDVSTEQAIISTNKAIESTASASSAAASSALITNKTEVNITTAGNILRADGTLFKSVSEVEFLANYEKFEKSPLSIMFPTGSKGPILWGLPNAPYSGQVPSAGFDNIQHPFFCTIQGGGAFSFAVEMLIQFYGSSSSYIYFAIGKDSNNYLLTRISRTDIRVSRKLNSVITVLSTTAIGNVINTQQYARITIQFGRTIESGSITSTFFPQITIPTPVNANNDFNFFGFGSDVFSGSKGIEKVVVYGDRIISIP